MTDFGGYLCRLTRSSRCNANVSFRTSNPFLHNMPVEVFIIYKKEDKKNDDEKLRKIYNEILPPSAVKRKFLVSMVING